MSATSPRVPIRPAEQKLLATRNTARFFTEARHISWVLLAFTLLWGAYAYFAMPQRKDPEIPVRVALVLCPWPGASAEQVEQLLTRRLEEKIAENTKVEKIESTSRGNLAMVFVHLVQDVENTGKELDDIELKLNSLRSPPDGAGPIHFVKDFGDTAALMLTVASPRIDGVEIDLRAAAIGKAIAKVREGAPAPAPGAQRVALVFGYPRTLASTSPAGRSSFSPRARPPAACGATRGASKARASSASTAKPPPATARSSAPRAPSSPNGCGPPTSTPTSGAAS